jgi:hypothetical protein
MSVSAVKGLLWVAIAVAIAMFIATASAALDRNESLALFFGGCILIVVTILWYRRVIPDAEAREEERHARQLVTLKQQLSLTGAPVSVKAWSGGFLVVGFVCASMFYGYRAFTSPGILSISMLVIAAILTAAVGFVFLPRVGKPALTIGRDGLTTPVFGFLRWEEIESIDLQSYTSRGVTTHSLDLHVPQLSDRERQIHPLLRATRRALFRGWRPNFVAIHLAFPSLPATLVHALCFDLWKERTGRPESMTSAISERFIEQMRERLGAEPAARRDALLDVLRTIDTADSARTKRVLAKHVRTYARDTAAKWAIVVVTLAALIVGTFVLLGG